MGYRDDDWDDGFDDDDLFYDPYDLNRDGETDLIEQNIAYETVKKEERERDSIFSTDEDGYWRYTCEDGSEFDVFPEDYETEEEYEEALEEAKYGWREECEDYPEYDIYVEDYETKEEYEEALHAADYGWHDECEDGFYIGIEYDEFDSKEEYEAALNKRKEEIAFINKRVEYAKQTLDRCLSARKIVDSKMITICDFIVKNVNKLVAATYMHPDVGFLYNNAINDHFSLPFKIPPQVVEFHDILPYIAKRVQDFTCVMQIWEWSLNQFIPYAMYSPDSIDYVCSRLTFSMPGILNVLGIKKSNFFGYYFTYEKAIPYMSAFVHYMDQNPKFYYIFMYASSQIFDRNSDKNILQTYVDLIGVAGNENLPGIAFGLLNDVNEICHRISEELKTKFIKRVIDICGDSSIEEINEYFKKAAAVYNYPSDSNSYQTEGFIKLHLEEIANTNETYTYCEVKFDGSTRPYFYRVKDISLEVGDKVIVPVGRGNEEKQGVVVSVGQYSEYSVPFPLEKTKFILRKYN